MTPDDLQRLFPDQVLVEVGTDADENEDLLHPVELALMGAMVATRRREFTAGRNAARRALARLGFADAALPRRGSSRDVEWPAGSAGSISHTRGLRAVACVRTGELLSVGIDVEEAGLLGADIIDAVCRPDELAALTGTPAPSPSDWPRLLFAMKEAAYKALYPITRRMLTFHDMRIAVTVDSKSFRAEVLHEPVARLQVGGRFGWNEHHVAAGAVVTASS
jgi:4'-phosphopantetheinyl transferase EntD